MGLSLWSNVYGPNWTGLTPGAGRLRISILSTWRVCPAAGTISKVPSDTIVMHSLHITALGRVAMQCTLASVLQGCRKRNSVTPTPYAYGLGLLCIGCRVPCLSRSDAVALRTTLQDRR